MAWWNFTRDVSGWQFWYFDKTPLLTVGALLGEKRMLFHLFLVVVLAGVCLVRLAQGRLGDRLLLFGFLAASVAGAAMVYMVGSGNFDFPEGLYCLLLLSAAGALLRLGLWLAERFLPVIQPYIPLACTMAAAGFCLFYLRSAQCEAAAYARVDVHADDYVEALGNRLPVHAGALKDMYAASEGGTLFSEYATGLTDMRGEIQPGSCDYIIHALGDELHSAYTADFAAGGYDFVQTIDPEKSPWDFWIFRCNWDFYKELYANYNVQGYYGAWRLWQHLPEGQSNTVTANNTVTVNPQGRGMVEILVESDYQGNCLADVTLDYESAFVSNLYRLQTWNRTVLAIDETNYPEYYYLPKSDNGHTVSVTLNEGWGRIVLLALPEQCTTLDVQATVSPILYPNAEVAPDP